MQSNTNTIKTTKIYYENYAYLYHHELLFNEIISYVKKNILHSDLIALKWNDDGEMISIVRDEDLQNCYACQENQKYIKLHLFKKKNQQQNNTEKNLLSIKKDLSEKQSSQIIASTPQFFVRDFSRNMMEFENENDKTIIFEKFIQQQISQVYEDFNWEQDLQRKFIFSQNIESKCFTSDQFNPPQADDAKFDEIMKKKKKQQYSSLNENNKYHDTSNSQLIPSTSKNTDQQVSQQIKQFSTNEFQKIKPYMHKSQKQPKNLLGFRFQEDIYYGLIADFAQDIDYYYCDLCSQRIKNESDIFKCRKCTEIDICEICKVDKHQQHHEDIYQVQEEITQDLHKQESIHSQSDSQHNEINNNTNNNSQQLDHTQMQWVHVYLTNRDS